MRSLRKQLLEDAAARRRGRKNAEANRAEMRKQRDGLPPPWWRDCARWDDDGGNAVLAAIVFPGKMRRS